MLIFQKQADTTVKVIYYLPDYTSIINEFVWQTTDFLPDFPRIRKFLLYWEENLEGNIKDIFLAYKLDNRSTKFADALFLLDKNSS